MDKKFCDKCSEKIGEKEKYYEIIVYDAKKEENELELDYCKKCRFTIKF